MYRKKLSSWMRGPEYQADVLTVFCDAKSTLRRRRCRSNHAMSLRSDLKLSPHHHIISAMNPDLEP